MAQISLPLTPSSSLLSYPRRQSSKVVLRLFESSPVILQGRFIFVTEENKNTHLRMEAGE